ncbi:glycosyltransferase family 4 protein [Acidisoma silvae]|uniref:Glycosyltransferase family 4 protein n=1 Tax=Acidisoma silvae TaxID=2802396 RepID=A0A963YW12_9PROT|nr:glycosyltransferase family 4 protein [Acidisoma silvae]MCB8878164.1 glycosyltransferase family 4 protein [Acidisoma silvae]
MRVAIHDYAGHPFQFDLSRALARLGHEVRHFYFGDDPGPKGDRNLRFDDPSGFSIEAIHIPLGYTKDRMLRRFAADQIYAVHAARRIAKFAPDIVVSGNSPLDVQRALRAATHRHGGTFVFWVQDFYGLAMQKLLARRWMGAGDMISKWYRKVEIDTLKKSDAIILISPAFALHLPSGLAARDAVHIMRNWGSVDLIRPGDRDNAWRRKIGLGEKFVFMYTGTLALKHDPALLLALSDAFADDPDVEIVVVAAGVNAQRLAKEQESAPRANLRLLPLQPAVELADTLATADVLVALLEEDAGEFAVPSKLLNYLCAGRPILLSAPSSNLSVSILAESEGGISVPPLDRLGFVTQARRLYEDSSFSQRLGRSGRDYAERHFVISEIAARFEAIFNQVRPAACLPSAPDKRRKISRPTRNDYPRTG